MWYLLLISTILASATAYPSDGVEIEKLKFVKFPEETYRYENAEQSDETRRILDEINKINIALGYIKKQEPKHSNKILDSETYLYPRPTYHPIHFPYNNVHQYPSASIRDYDGGSSTLSRKALYHQSLMYPRPFEVPSSYQVSPYISLPFRNNPKKFDDHRYTKNENEEPAKVMAVSRDVSSIVEFFDNPQLTQLGRLAGSLQNADNEQYKNQLLQDVKQIVEEIRQNSVKTKHFNSKHQHKHKTAHNSAFDSVKYVILPAKLHTISEEHIRRLEEEAYRKPTETESQESQSVEQNGDDSDEDFANDSAIGIISVDSDEINDRQQPLPYGNTSVKPVTDESVDLEPNTVRNTESSEHQIEGYEPGHLQADEKNISNLNTGEIELSLNRNLKQENRADQRLQNINGVKNISTKADRQRPNTKVQKVVQTTENIASEKSPFAFFRKPTLAPVLTTLKPERLASSEVEADSYEDNDGESEKHLFSAHRKEMIELEKQAVKEGGIIIKRLKVRKGGIAIAGPGGVATAGSGGTAIVGPGGLAFTHPKSLTIAGPGARVISLPESFDLQKAVLSSNPYIVPNEGRVVATGPVIYYNQGLA